MVCLKQQLLYEGFNRALKFGLLRHNVKFIILVTNFQRKILNHWAEIFKYFSVLNYIIIYNDPFHKAFTFNQFNNIANEMENQQVPSLFYEKLQDLHGYEFKLV